MKFRFQLKQQYPSFRYQLWKSGSQQTKPLDQAIDWFLVETYVVKQQTRIFIYSKYNLLKKMRKAQEALMRSLAAKLLAVRQVCVENVMKTKKHNKEIPKIPSSQDLFALASSLKLTGEADPVLRIFIPKPGTTEKRPLGIPTERDKALQALVRFAIEPEWEARFEGRSVGFRCGRGAGDANKTIESALKRPKYVLDADLRKCFDRIDHDALLSKLGYKVGNSLYNQIQAWLKAGYLENGQFKISIAGTPQGGVISPLLANIALHGMENFLKEKVAQLSLRGKDGSFLKASEKRKSLTGVRYADDFIILHQKKSVIQMWKRELEEWLKPLGLSFNEKKTKICHPFLSTDNHKPSFCFLGFQSKHVKNAKQKLTLSISPTNKAIHKHVTA